MEFDRGACQRTLDNARRRLLAARGPDGHWEGELAASPLSTATAVFAFAWVDRARGTRHTQQIERGVAWLVKAQQADGGWGDTLKSNSNISTTSLVWAALVALDAEGHWMPARTRAEQWLTRAIGSLRPAQLAEAITARYGRDRTFAVPILAVLALAGRLGDGDEAWSLVPQLPFELAACPQAWFRWLRLPVVSYALPALVALGRLRHVRRPTRNPLARAARRLAERRSLALLAAIQPTNGGFLEATPLTGFVVMSLAAGDLHQHPVVDKGLEFLGRSQRPDGSWPIDTNLSTWVTTLSVNALYAAAAPTSLWAPQERRNVLHWLLGQQIREEHPYTRAAPGGWAWTDLPGGVPDADDTPGAILALRQFDSESPETRRAAAAGIGWLLDLQNRDGGIPTFCRGWGLLPFDRSSADLTAHTVLAVSAWLDHLPSGLRARGERALVRMLDYLVRAQRMDGAWAPLWFGDQNAPSEVNLTYGTSRVIRIAGIAAQNPNHHQSWRTALLRGFRWLLAAQNNDGGWGGAVGSPSSIEETALALEGLSSPWRTAPRPDLPEAGEWAVILPELDPQEVVAALGRGGAWLSTATDEGHQFPPSPIGFYFAKLWYFEQLYPLIYTVAALGRLQVVLQASSADSEVHARGPTNAEP